MLPALIPIAPLVRVFAELSLLSIGGINAAVPEIHRQVVELHGWMDDRAFSSLVAVAQIAPGPNLLIVSLIGWSLAGAAGLAAATAAMVLPSSLLAVGAGRLLVREGRRASVAVIRSGLAPVALGLMAASSLVMARASYVDWASLVLAVLAAGLSVATRLSPLWSLAGAAILAIALHHLAVAF